MARRSRIRLVKTMTDVLAERDRRQMAAVDTVLSLMANPTPRRRKRRQKRTSKTPS